MKNKPFIVGVDIGGTKVRVGLVRPSRDKKGHVQMVRAIETKTDVKGKSAALKQLESIIQNLIAEDKSRIAGIGIGAPGPLDRKKGALLCAPNLPNWSNVPIGPWVSRRFKLPAIVENDANAASLSEALWGAGKNKRFVFYATISTGIGTGLVIDKKLYAGGVGLALEAGHATIDVNGRPCQCGLKGCIEAYASGPSMVRRAREIWPSASA
ncbi:MAG: ROK family protein, partial [Elusimicrobia bacterium]|nr:ROK family protein [Elusimicrobiota bacterium]